MAQTAEIEDRTLEAEWHELVASGDESFQRGALLDARHAYERALTLREHSSVVYSLGEVHLYLQDPAVAVRLFRRYLTLMSAEAAG